MWSQGIAMTVAGKRRRYDSTARKSAAALTRRSIIEAARRVFIDKGYAGATMQAIATDAGIALDTVYASVGKKPAIFKLLVEAAISGHDGAVAVEDRDYVQAIRAADDAREKLRIYASALRDIHPRLAPLFNVLQAAGKLDSELNALWQEISERRAANMRLLAEDLSTTGQLRSDLTISHVADIIWSLNSPEFYLLLVGQRGWSPGEFEEWLADAWIRLILDPGSGA